MSVTLGSDRLFDSGALKGRRIGVVANPASVDGSFRHVVDRAASARDATLAAVFGPQHGFRADLQDNMIESPHTRDPRRRVMVYSLYSETREPTADMLSGLDALVVDLQDAGARIYTFVYTMANCLRAAARHGVKVYVCDRPNPIGGVAVEGPMLEPGFESFVGRFPIPMRHGMTMGELARLFNEAFDIVSKGGAVVLTALAPVADVTPTLPTAMITLFQKRLLGSLYGEAAHLDSGQAVGKGHGFVKLRVDHELAALVHESPATRLADLRHALRK